MVLGIWNLRNPDVVARVQRNSCDVTDSTEVCVVFFPDIMLVISFSKLSFASPRRSSAATCLLRFGHGCLSVVSDVCCQVEISASGRSLVHRSSSECGASLCVN
jgi:hypothetical protein